MNTLNWYLQGTSQSSNNIPLPAYRAKIGYDIYGHLWVCETKYIPHINKFLVRFDYETKDEPLFLKDIVLDSDNYLEAQKQHYFLQFVAYDRIPETIDNFRGFMIDDSVDM